MANQFITWIKANPAKSVIIALLVYAFIATAVNKTSTNNGSYTDTASQPTGSDAYGICTQIARQRWGSADFEKLQEIDMGGGEWIIHGSADIPGRRIYWVGDVKHNPTTDKWDVIEFREKL